MNGDQADLFSLRVPSSDAAFILVGPTAVGKSAVAEHLAKQYGLGLLSCDSMMVYTGMDIGTAKPDASTLKRLKYRGVNLTDPSQSFSTGMYIDHASEVMREAERKGTVMLVTGGTGLYVRCMTSGLDEVPEPSPDVRSAVRALHEAEGVEGLQQALRRESPEHFQNLADPENPRRLMRALELVRENLDVPDAWLARTRATVVGLQMERSQLRQRIYDRVQEMYRRGLLLEAEELRESCKDWSPTAAKAIGYQEALACLDGAISREEAIHQTVVRTCQYAKRQMTYFRNQLDVRWVDVEADSDSAELGDAVVRLWERLGPSELILPGRRKASVSYTMRGLPKTMQPREIFEKRGEEALTDQQLLALLLRSGTQGTNALSVAEQMLVRYKTLTRLAACSVKDLCTFPGVGMVKAQILKATFELARRVERETPDRPVLRSPAAAVKVLRGHARGKTQEIFWVLLLDVKYRLQREPFEVSKGILDASLVHPREVFREAIRSSSSAIVLAHNHPSGDTTPSPEDRRITKSLVEAGKIVDIDVLDHVILGQPSEDNPDGYLSLRESGLVEF